MDWYKLMGVFCLCFLLVGSVSGATIDRVRSGDNFTKDFDKLNITDDASIDSFKTRIAGDEEVVVELYYQVKLLNRKVSILQTTLCDIDNSTDICSQGEETSREEVIRTGTVDDKFSFWDFIMSILDLFR